MKSTVFFFCVVLIVIVPTWGCVQISATDLPLESTPTINDEAGSDDATTDDPNADDGSDEGVDVNDDPGGADPDAMADDGTSDDGGTVDDPSQNPDDGAGLSARTLSGAIQSSALALQSARVLEGEEVYEVVAMSAETFETYRGQTDDTGEFEIEIPEEEPGELFMVSIVTADGRPAGPVVLGQEGEAGFTGLEFADDVDLGTIEFPEDPAAEPIVPGTDSTLMPENIAEDVFARVDENGVPVGVPEIGRGEEAEGEPTDDPRLACDADQDGMIDIFDADDDGDGIVDDFDDDATINPGFAEGLIINFFMNLKISDERAQVYFDGDVAGIDDSLMHDTVITFEVRAETGFTKTMTAARIIGPPSPAPPYLTGATVLGTNDLWSDSGYALDPDGANHFQQWVIPNDFMNTGDTFTVEVTFDDGSTRVFSRMINYVFKSIPKLEQVGAPSAMTAYAGPAEIQFDGNQDLVLEWAPPVDDFGRLLVGLPYRFEIFYYDEFGSQINDIDASSWTSVPSGWDTQSAGYDVEGTALSALSASNTFTVELPNEIFVDTVQTGSGTVDVTSYKIDIAAQNNGNNSALMLPARKQ